MNRFRKAIVVAAAAVSVTLAAPAGPARAEVTKEPDCTWTNDSIAVCKYKDGSSVCYDHYGKKIDCPESRGNTLNFTLSTTTP